MGKSEFWEWRRQPIKRVLQFFPIKNSIRVSCSTYSKGLTREFGALSNTGGQDNLSAELIKEIRIPRAPISEQSRVVDVLRTWDAAVSRCHRLLALKEMSYRAIAKKFFDPCHPNFQSRPQTWRSFELGDVFTERAESGNGKDRLLSITMADGVIDREEVGRKDTSREDKSKYKLIRPGDIGYNTMRMWQGVSGLSTLRGIVSPAYTIVVPDTNNILGPYAAHLFKSKRMVFDFERFSQGLTSDTWNLKFPAFSEIQIYLPPIEIQQRQSQALDDLLGEISILRAWMKVVERKSAELCKSCLQDSGKQDDQDNQQSEGI